MLTTANTLLFSSIGVGQHFSCVRAVICVLLNPPLSVRLSYSRRDLTLNLVFQHKMYRRNQTLVFMLNMCTPKREKATPHAPANIVLLCSVWSYWSWPGMLFVLWITACRLMTNPTHLNPLTMYWLRTDNYTQSHVLEMMSCLLCVSNSFKHFMIFVGEKSDCCVWPQLNWRASFDTGWKMEKWQSRGPPNEAGLIKLAGEMLSKAFSSLKSETQSRVKTDVPGFYFAAFIPLIKPPSWDGSLTWRTFLCRSNPALTCSSA